MLLLSFAYLVFYRWFRLLVLLGRLLVSGKIWSLEFSSVILEVVNRMAMTDFLRSEYRKVSSPFLSLPFSFTVHLFGLSFSFFLGVIVNSSCDMEEEELRWYFLGSFLNPGLFLNHHQFVTDVDLVFAGSGVRWVFAGIYGWCSYLFAREELGGCSAGCSFCSGDLWYR